MVIVMQACQIGLTPVRRHASAPKSATTQEQGYGGARPSL